MLTVHYRAPLALDWTLDDAGQRRPASRSFEETERRVEYLYTTRAAARVDRARAHRRRGRGARRRSRRSRRAARARSTTTSTPPVAIAASSELLDAGERARRGGSKRKKGTVARARSRRPRSARFGRSRTHLGLGGQDPDTVLLRIRARRADARGLAEADVEAEDPRSPRGARREGLRPRRRAPRRAGRDGHRAARQPGRNSVVHGLRGPDETRPRLLGGARVCQDERHGDEG